MDGREGAEPDMKGDARDFDAAGSNGFQYLRCKVQSRGGRCDRPTVAGIDGLVALAVRCEVIPMNVGRQRHVTDLVENGKEIIDWSEFEEPVAELAALQDLGFEQDGA